MLAAHRRLRAVRASANDASAVSENDGINRGDDLADQATDPSGGDFTRDSRAVSLNQTRSNEIRA